MSLHSLYHPEIFQGNLQKTNYFEGWYFKQVAKDSSEVLSIIPGVSLAKDPHAFIQVINGITGQTHYIDFPLADFKADEKKLILQIGDNKFSEYGIDLNINHPDLKLNGHMIFQNRVTWPGKPWAPGIMGWYSFVPKMECYHAVVSLDHTIQGELTYQDQKINFDDGRGYIEKDWGTSMPESWIWLHTNTFESPGTSVMLSIAKIPWMKSHFTGFIAFVLHEKKIYRFATYNGSSIASFFLQDQDFAVTLKHRKYQLTIKARQKIAGKLKAPVKGLMERYIKESIDSDIAIRLSDNRDTVIFEGMAHRSGLELVGNPDTLLSQTIQ